MVTQLGTFKIRLEFFSCTEQDLSDPNVEIYIRNGPVSSLYSQQKAIHISTACFASS